MNNNHNSIQIFTYDKETERQTGALTKMIFAGCFLIFPASIGIFGILGTSLLPALLSDMFSYVFYEPYLSILDSIVYFLMMGMVVLSFFFMIVWIMPAVYQLLRCYCILGDGRLAMLEWKPRQRYCKGASIVSENIETHLNLDSSATRRGVRSVFGILYGIEQIQNRQWVRSYLSGENEESQVAGYIISNIRILKENQSCLMIMADVNDGEQVKRRKLKIYRMYCQMEKISSICEKGGRS